MNNTYDMQTGAPTDPVTHPDVPDRKNPETPEPAPDPPEPSPVPPSEPLPEGQPDTEPIREPDPIPPFPEPLPGGPPNVVV